MIKRISALLAALLICFISCCFGGCSGNVSYISDTFISMDTVITVKIDPDVSDSDAIFKRCREITEQQRQIYDVDDEKSFLGSAQNTEISAGIQFKQIPEDIYNDLSHVIDCGNLVNKLSDGAFSLCLRPLILYWKSAEAAQAKPSAEAISILKEQLIGSCEIINSENEQIKNVLQIKGLVDFGGIAKGAAEAAVIEYLKTTDAGYGVVSFGGNIAVFGQRPDGKDFVIGIKDPDNTQDTVGIINIDSGFVSVSGDYERYYEINGVKYHHILDPKTGYPADSGLRSVAVWARDGAMADALSTALFVMGERKAFELYEKNEIKFEAVFITDSEVSYTPGLEGNFRQNK